MVSKKYHLRRFRRLLTIVAGVLLFSACGFGSDSGNDAQSAGKEPSSIVSLAAGATREQTPMVLVFSGDVMQHMPQVAAAQQGDGSYSYADCFRYITPFWQQADYTIVNLETTLTGNGHHSGYPCFASPKELAADLLGAGVDICALANNHCCDKGRQGLLSTFRTLDSLGLKHLGVYADSASARVPLILGKGSMKVALLNYTYGTNGMPVPASMVVNQIDMLGIARDVAAAKMAGARYVIAFMHWGEEYQRMPNHEQRALVEWCRGHGVEAIVGSHPHVVQPIDSTERVVYSLGNFVSNQSDRYTDGGISVRLTITPRRGLVSIEWLPHWVYTPVENGVKQYYVLPYWPASDFGAPVPAEFFSSLKDIRDIVGRKVRTDMPFEVKPVAVREITEVR